MTTESKKEQEKTPEQTKFDAMEEIVGTLIDKVEELTKGVEALSKTTVKKSSGLFGGKREKTAVKDTKTGKIYPSKAAVGKALCDEVGVLGTDHFAWYKLIGKFPDRFQELPADSPETKAAWKEQQDQLDAEVAEANKAIQAEEEAKKKAESTAPKK